MKLTLAIYAILAVVPAVQAVYLNQDDLSSLAQAEAEMIPGMPGGAPPGASCKAGPGHQNTPTINIIDTSQKQEHKMVPTHTAGHHHMTAQAKRHVHEAAHHHAKEAVH